MHHTIFKPGHGDSENNKSIFSLHALRGEFYPEV